jgi:predicted DNA-binding transcriptional regulator AlpA
MKTKQQTPEIPTTPERYLRIWDIIGDRKRGILPIIPVSKSCWWAGIRSGRYPKQVKLSQRCSGWRESDIRAITEVA